MSGVPTPTVWESSLPGRATIRARPSTAANSEKATTASRTPQIPTNWSYGGAASPRNPTGRCSA